MFPTGKARALLDGVAQTRLGSTGFGKALVHCLLDGARTDLSDAARLVDSGTGRVP